MGLVKLENMRKLDLMKVRCSTYATFTTFVALLFLAIAFVSSHWFECKTIPNQRFKRLGLWEACFEKLHDHHYRYDKIIMGCKWIFDEDYSFMIDFLEPCK